MNKSDALAAINICEKFIHVFHEKDGFSSPKEENLSSVEEIDAYHAQFSQWFDTMTKSILYN